MQRDCRRRNGAQRVDRQVSRRAFCCPGLIGGQGSWHIGQGRHLAADEEESLRTGLSLGMRLIDTSGNYGEGRSEELIKRVIAGQRDRAFFVVSKGGSR